MWVLSRHSPTAWWCEMKFRLFLLHKKIRVTVLPCGGDPYVVAVPETLDHAWFVIDY